MRYGSEQFSGRVFFESASFTIALPGEYIVSSSGGVRTVTLPTLASVSRLGFWVAVKREGSNFVDLVAAGSDEFETSGISTKRLFNDFSTVGVRAHASGSVWYEWGFFGGVQES